MKPSWLGFPLALSGLATSSVPVSAQSTKEEWTVSDARRTKSNSNTLCAWSFTVDPSSGKHADSSFQCSFNVTTSSGGDCGLVSFAEDSCSGNGSFAVDGGHSDFGFVVMVLVNPDQRSQAYFGFSDDALDTGSDIPKQTKSVIPQGTRRRRDGVAVRQRLDGDDIDDDITPSSTAWAVEDLFRGRWTGHGT
ncbi:uncharacterized protein GGS25DRAFT_295106 [Hypoxylon fragiforme]|uniref:uncharacterized protein n=1 Tax=Hypoxylon fragiforme TaxID=63214 RepID=UPI0020C624B7|nr:uncharacterized protein GGS25DRAFT_295106 [Hypoxylon fragiforme]KAI2608913.1 hypothetical protein GGS25DRAFT_295106 [Hypoxylon fragiforme]